MIELTVRVTGADGVARRMKRRAVAVHGNLAAATKDGTGLVHASARDRVVPARSINVQDGRRYRRLSGRKPVRSRFENDGLTGWVHVGQHQTVVHSKALTNVYDKIGRGGDLIRKRGLFIDPDSWTKGPGGRFTGRRRMRYTDGTDKNLLLFRFSHHPDLEAWANRRDKGFQILRHSIRIRREAITLLTTAPALKVNYPTIQSRYRAAVVSGIAQ
jgi:hypothetical protein